MLRRARYLRFLVGVFAATTSYALYCWSDISLFFDECCGWMTFRVAKACGILIPGTYDRTYFGTLFGVGPGWLYRLADDITAIVVAAPPVIVGILIYHWLTFRHRRDAFTRCGNCEYILRGLIYPRCPECGKDV